MCTKLKNKSLVKQFENLVRLKWTIEENNSGTVTDGDQRWLGVVSEISLI